MSDNGSSDLPPIFKESAVDLAQEASAPKDDSLFHCENCGLPLVYGGRGRHPKRCVRGEGCRSEDSAPAPATGRRTGDIDRIRQGMTELYVMLGAGVSIVDHFDGMAIGGSASKLAESWAQLAQQDPKVRKALMKALTGTSWTGVIVAHAMVAVPIMQHHGMIPSLFERKVPSDSAES